MDDQNVDAVVASFLDNVLALNGVSAAASFAWHLERCVVQLVVGECAITDSCVESERGKAIV